MGTYRLWIVRGPKMPISSGALDWPVSYYSKPTAVENVATGYDNLDPWSLHHAYRNWTWKKMRNNRKKKKDKDSPEERRLHRRRCCCCVLWWLTALLLIILTLVLFMVFWTRYRGSNLPDINFDQYENLPSCHGTWRKTFTLCNNGTTANATYQCCYGVDALMAVSGHGDAWPDGWTFNGPCTRCKTSNAAFPQYPVWSAPTHQLSSCVLFGLAWIVLNQIMENYVHG